MTRQLRLFAFGFVLVLGALSQAPVADSVTPSGDEIIARVETENGRRHALLKDYSIALQYTLQNPRFGKQAAVGVLMDPAPGHQLMWQGYSQLQIMCEGFVLRDSEES
jgi:hypothetical protein